MKATICFVIFLLSTAWADLAGECNLVGFYLELGCKALPKVDNTTSCPDAFQCPDLHPDPNMCYYRGVAYADRSMIPQNLIKNSCSQACFCNMFGGPQFDCAAVDCFESFKNDELDECIYTYELDSCCSTGTVCGKDAIGNLKTCEVDGQTFKEGQSFYPANTQKMCICSAQWNGTTDDPTMCRDVNCGLEIHYQDKILDNCAPVYFGDSKGNCPIAFTCPSNSTKIIRGLNLRSVPVQCSFGNLTLNVGDDVIVDEKCTKCSCDVPPFVSCVKKASCDE
ncbi:unnamed protein product, partial [Brenthis ino]